MAGISDDLFFNKGLTERWFYFTSRLIHWFVFDDEHIIPLLFAAVVYLNEYHAGCVMALLDAVALIITTASIKRRWVQVSWCLVEVEVQWRIGTVIWFWFWSSNTWKYHKCQKVKKNVLLQMLQVQFTQVLSNLQNIKRVLKQKWNIKNNVFITVYA